MWLNNQHLGPDKNVVQASVWRDYVTRVWCCQRWDWFRLQKVKIFFEIHPSGSRYSCWGCGPGGKCGSLVNAPRLWWLVVEGLVDGMRPHGLQTSTNPSDSLSLACRPWKCGSSINKRCLKRWLVGLPLAVLASLAQTVGFQLRKPHRCQKYDSIIWRRCLKRWLGYL